MLNSFFVSNFRLFKRLELPELGRVNLIVGKNGSGKSALLEAIRLYATNGEPETLKHIIAARQEFWDREHPEEPLFINAVCHLFYDHELPSADEEGIKIGVSKSISVLNFKIAWFKLQETKDGELKRIRVTQPAIEDLIETKIEKALLVEDETQVYQNMKLSQSLSEKFLPRIGVFSEKNRQRCQVQFVPTQNADIADMASMWDATTLTSLEDDVISGMKILSPKIQGLNFVENRASGFWEDRRIALVKLEDSTDPLPLKNMGDGIFRLFHIVLALVNANDGILLIDEFENGLHWKIHPKIWDVVFQLSRKLNVQVFATTHSQDCIRGFERAWRDHLDAGRFFRLDVKDGNVKPTYYNHETLLDALTVDVEVR